MAGGFTMSQGYTDAAGVNSGPTAKAPGGALIPVPPVALMGADGSWLSLVNGRVPVDIGSSEVTFNVANLGVWGIDVAGQAPGHGYVAVGGLGADGFVHGLSTDNTGKLNLSADTNTGAAGASTLRTVLDSTFLSTGKMKLVDSGGTNLAAISAAGALSVTPDAVLDGVTYAPPTVTSATTIITFTPAQLQGMGYISFGFPAVGGGATVAVDQAIDSTTFEPALFWRTDGSPLSLGTLAGQLASAINPASTWQFVVPITAPSMRIKLSAYTSGNYTMVAIVKRGACPAASAAYVQSINTSNVAGTVASGVADSTSPVKTGGKVSAPVSGLTPGNRQDTLVSTAGNQFVEEGGRSYVNITSAATTNAKSGAGFFHAITVNTPVAGETITVYDSLTGSGTKIATITIPATITGESPFTLIYNAAFLTGLTFVTSSTADITATFR